MAEGSVRNDPWEAGSADESGESGESGFRELFRQEVEGITDRLDVLLQAGTPGAGAEALRLAHTLKGLAVAAQAHPLRDLARSLEAALAAYDPRDPARRDLILSAIDAARGLIGGAPGAPAAARTATAALAEDAPGERRPTPLPWARRALLRRLLLDLDPLLEAADEHLTGLERGRDRWRARADVAHELELWFAAAGLLGHSPLAGLGLQLAAALGLRNLGQPAVEAARQVLGLVRSQREDDAVDGPLDAHSLSGMDALRGTLPPRPEEERIPLSVEFPWPDVDQPAALVQALDRASGERTIVDGQPATSSGRLLSGVLGLLPRRRRTRESLDVIRVPRRRLDRLQALAERLVGLRSQAHALDGLAHTLAEEVPVGARLAIHRLARRAEELDRELDHLSRATQEAVQRARLVPMRGLFALARATVREHLSRHPDKAVELEVDGASTKIDKGILDGLVDPLLHLLKNALQHGVEARAERIAAGKPEVARIRMVARSTPAGVRIEVDDDGRGLDEERLLQAGEAQGLVLLKDEAEQGLALAYASGVTTADQLTDDAGRGVGLLSVLDRVRALRGRLVYRSTPGVGTLARVVVPPAVSTARVLLVRVGTERYALPLASVVSVKEAAGAPSRLPVVRLIDLVDPPPPEAERRRGRRPPELPRERRMSSRFRVVIAPPYTRSDDREEQGLECVVDDVLRRDLVVVRPLGRRFAPPGIEAAALFGDGRIALVLDVWRLFGATETSGYRLPGGRRGARRRSPRP